MCERWIIIGSVKSDVQLYGFRMVGRGYWINWRGRIGWCQPCEFETAGQLEWSVRRRLLLAGLKLLALASDPRRSEYQELWALVGRIQ